MGLFGIIKNTIALPLDVIDDTLSILDDSEKESETVKRLGKIVDNVEDTLISMNIIYVIKEWILLIIWSILFVIWACVHNTIMNGIDAVKIVIKLFKKNKWSVIYGSGRDS